MFTELSPFMSPAFGPVEDDPASTYADSVQVAHVWPLLHVAGRALKPEPEADCEQLPEAASR
jgi:hypothetical protein